MPELLDLTHEILHLIFSHTDADDLARISETCRSLHQFITADDILWKVVHLGVFDDPKQQSATVSSWQDELSRMWKLHKILSSQDEKVKAQNLEFVATAIIQLLKTSSPQPESKTRSWLRRHFENDLNYHHLLCESALFRDFEPVEGVPTRSSSAGTTIDQLSAKLLVLHGVYREDSEHSYPDPVRLPRLDWYARSRVYDLRQWHQGNSWGPFTDDSSNRVDWVKMSWLMIVLLSQQRRYCQSIGSSYLPVWHLPFAGAAPNTFVDLDRGLAPAQTPPQPKSSHPDARILKGPELSLDNLDPYGVTGTWFRIVNFLDYSALFQFNSLFRDRPNSVSLPPLSKPDATRFLVVHLHVTKIEPVTRDGKEQLPVVYFEGKVRIHEDFEALPGFHSTTRGHVRENPEGEIWWSLLSVVNGEERWKTECIQVGGVRSERGVLGTWFDTSRDHAENGPIGPTCFWKVSDRHLEKDMPMMMRRAKPGQRGWRRYG